MTENSSSEPTFTSYHVPVPGNCRLHLMRIQGSSNGPVVFLVHGSLENGRIFYSETGKGLAPYLARAGYDVFAADLRGKGESQPSIGPHAPWGQNEAITEDIPALINFIEGLRPEAKQVWIGHSWGGVLLNAFYARFPDYRRPVRAMVHFASKRMLRVKNWRRFVGIELVWLSLGWFTNRLLGYYPARLLRIGADDETRAFHQQTSAWLKPSAWVDPMDDFDYGEAVTDCALPPTLYLTGKRDHFLGHESDVKRFMEESGTGKKAFILLSKENGNQADYGHVDILTHPKAPLDHYPIVLQWINECLD